VCPCLTPGGATDRVESWAWTAVTAQNRSSAPITRRRMLDFLVDIMMKGYSSCAVDANEVPAAGAGTSGSGGRIRIT